MHVVLSAQWTTQPLRSLLWKCNLVWGKFNIKWNVNSLDEMNDRQKIKCRWKKEETPTKIKLKHQMKGKQKTKRNCFIQSKDSIKSVWTNFLEFELCLPFVFLCLCVCLQYQLSTSIYTLSIQMSTCKAESKERKKVCFNLRKNRISLEYSLVELHTTPTIHLAYLANTHHVYSRALNGSGFQLRRRLNSEQIGSKSDQTWTSDFLRWFGWVRIGSELNKARFLMLVWVDYSPQFHGKIFEFARDFR